MSFPATIPEVRAALAATVTAAAAAGDPPLRVSSQWPGQVNPPTLVVSRSSTDYGTGSLTGRAKSQFVLGIYVMAEDVSAQDVIDQYLAPSGPTSLIAAIKADTTLGGVAQNAIPATVGGEVLADIGGVQYLSVQIPVDVTH